MRGSERLRQQRGQEEVWHTFFSPAHPAHLAHGFGVLMALAESRLPPGADTVAHAERDAEMVTYVRRGALCQEESADDSVVIQAGEFQVMSTGRRIRHRERSVSPSDCLHMFRVTLRPSEAGLARAQDQRRFTTAQRRHLLCVVASPDGRGGSLRIHQDAVVISSALDSGHHVVHMLDPGRSAWLHIVTGEATIHDTVLTAGDGVGITAEPTVSLTARVSTELLLIDLGTPPRLRGPGAPPWEHPAKGAAPKRGT